MPSPSAASAPPPALPPERPALPAAQDFGSRVRDAFGRQAGAYDGEARLQRAIAWRLAGLCRDLPLPAGPCADLGAGSGLLSRALTSRHPGLAQRPPLQLDLCPDLLARNPLPQQRPWDLNRGLPPELEGAALLASSFALQWLERPAASLRLWCRQLAPGGWLVLALPTAGSFPQWRQAAAAAAVPCSALALPRAAELLAVAAGEGLVRRQGQVRHFSRPGQPPLESLRALRRLGASASRSRPLTPGQWRRLLHHWPGGAGLSWEVLLLVAQRPLTPEAESSPCAW
ncbi:MAG: SAM-dependent methyltransferase [Synechococcaceae cyanobacterium]|nr:SAM-dependent methyltransferase [Synechococcaceae cyanobacterium]